MVRVGSALAMIVSPPQIGKPDVNLSGKTKRSSNLISRKVFWQETKI